MLRQRCWHQTRLSPLDCVTGQHAVVGEFLLSHVSVTNNLPQKRHMAIEDDTLLRLPLTPGQLWLCVTFPSRPLDKGGALPCSRQRSQITAQAPAGERAPRCPQLVGWGGTLPRGGTASPQMRGRTSLQDGRRRRGTGMTVHALLRPLLVPVPHPLSSSPWLPVSTPPPGCTLTLTLTHTHSVPSVCIQRCDLPLRLRRSLTNHFYTVPYESKLPRCCISQIITFKKSQHPFSNHVELKGTETHPSSSAVCDQRAPLPAGALVLALWGGGTVGAHIPAPPSSTAVPAQLSAVSKDNGKVSRAALAGEAGAGRKRKVSASISAGCAGEVR